MMTYRSQGRGSSKNGSIDQDVERKISHLLPEGQLDRIILQDDPESIQLLNEAAERIGREIAKKVTTSQIRAIFSEARSIEQDVRQEVTLEPSVQRRLMMLRPKLAYQFGRLNDREQKVAMGVLTSILSQAIAKIGTRVDAFHNFMDFFEAILAYHRRYGGKTS